MRLQIIVLLFMVAAIVNGAVLNVSQFRNEFSFNDKR